jgi:hypothetical protein
MDGEPRDVRTSPESPALWPGELSDLMLSLLLPSYPPSSFYLAGNGRQRPFHPPFLGHESRVTSRVASRES